MSERVTGLGRQEGCDCCDHPLQHAIREALAHDAAPIPLAARESRVIFANLQAALIAWEEEQNG